MTFEEFKSSLSADTPQAGMPKLAEALWYDAKGNWDKAHDIAQETNSPDHCLLHAYLHRKEGDTWNANYWYNRAGRKMPSTSLEAEWEAISREFLRY
ncbi:hypothetical protein Q0590_11010 [Rhodocytophaga aerolata]|uniref:Tetratricopeptide repeat protein n=1 Tax=Rhodocytophaga aerolata TaxID=455078 RepID=A0ABT8R7Y1_9BACT|nr:hypothetical protein [Rhodocytophaga aerolata]MDO1446785.1 hypothetical protein [Rhodocytophaga aerolata]